MTRGAPARTRAQTKMANIRSLSSRMMPNPANSLRSYSSTWQLKPTMTGRDQGSHR